MSLRRFAQVNAANVPGTPHSPSPQRSSLGTQTPATPRTRISYLDSPSLTPSISSSTPFDWEAARSRRPPPYATPPSVKRKARMSTANAATSPRKAFIRKKGFVERISDIPSRVMFEISLFPHNVPLPAPKTSAWLIGMLMHTVHFFVRVSQVRSTPDTNLGWEDLYWERSQQSWFDWTVPTTCTLLIVSTLSALHLFSQTRTYQLHRRSRGDPVNSAHTTFVPSPQRDLRVHSEVPVPKSTFARRIAGLLHYIVLVLWRVVVSVVRFLLGFSWASPSTSSPPQGAPAEVIQQLEMWVPGELERTLLGVYSPVHALLWMCTGSTNWVLMCAVMCVVGLQTGTLIEAYEGLVKDKGILAAEVMHEYNEGFVYPKMNPVRRDVAVMTHESEMIL
ncbi:hypothetical protein L210DRAFT_3390949 [Boletus edulis BED1]|uniref:Nuclear rim protein 1 n=1 Tax=Boletus edulis BED1 TaxID=1328754 RepID=A0AAD4GJT8_BOLED|nr:hypothetical protein L210DRAFT_3390949 [Boletus edulis BED1]